jgi:hypothetical protein
MAHRKHHSIDSNRKRRGENGYNTSVSYSLVPTIRSVHCFHCFHCFLHCFLWKQISLMPLFTGFRHTNQLHNGSDVSIVDTLINLFTVIMVNTSAKLMVDIVTKHSSFDIFTALFMLTILLQCCVTFYRRFCAPPPTM